MRLGFLILVLVTASTSPAQDPAEETPGGGTADTCPVSEGSSATQDHRPAMAAAALGDSGAEEDLLAALAQAEDESEQSRIVRLLGKIGSERSLPALLDLVGERFITDDVQAALARIDPQWRLRPEVERTVARLSAGLDALPDEVGKPAICASPRLAPSDGSEDAAVDDALSELCNDPRWAEREMCWARQARIALLATFDRDRAVDAAQVLFDAGRCVDDDGVLGLLAEEGRLEVAVALDHLLSGAVSDWSEDDLTEALDRAHPQWRDGPEASRTRDRLVERLKSDSAAKRLTAVRLLAALRLPGDATELIRILDDPSRSDNERGSAAHALEGESGPARDALERCAKSATGWLQAACAEVLVGTEPADGLRAFRRLLASPDAGERRTGLLGLVPLRAELDPATRTLAARVCLEIIGDGGDETYWAMESLEHFATPEILPQVRELFARRGELEYGSDPLVRILLEAGGADELPRVMDVAYEEPDMLPDVAQVLAQLEWVPASTFDEVLDLLRTRGGPPTADTDDEPATDWRLSQALNTIVERLMASPEEASMENLRWLAHHPEARIRAQARYAAFKAGISLEPPP